MTDEPVSNITIQQEVCRYHCEAGWLASKGEEDAVLITREMAIDAGDRDLEGQVIYLLLLPTQLIPCFICNELSSLNDDLGEI